MWSQRLKIKACDAADQQQVFRFDRGMIQLASNPKICVGWEVSETGQIEKVAMTLIKCYREVRILNAKSLNLDF